MGEQQRYNHDCDLTRATWIINNAAKSLHPKLQTFSALSATQHVKPMKPETTERSLTSATGEEGSVSLFDKRAVEKAGHQGLGPRVQGLGFTADALRV